MDIYKMKLHETAWSNKLSKNIFRVPGGWLYCDYDVVNDVPLPGGVFVPFHNEFMEGDKNFDDPQNEDASDVPGFPTLEECIEDARHGIAGHKLTNIDEHFIGSTWAYIEGKLENHRNA